MCSRKWASPLVRTSSAREPAPTNTLTLTDWAVGTGVVTTRRPPSSSLISQVMGMGPPFHQIGRDQYIGWLWVSRRRCVGARCLGRCPEGGRYSDTLPGAAGVFDP